MALFTGHLGLEPGVGLQEVIDAAALIRGRPITLLEMLLPPRLSGFCVQGAQDTIVVTTRDTRRQRTHDKLHELSHLLESPHPPVGGLTGHALLNGHELLEGAVHKFPSLPPGVAEDFLNSPVQLRSSYLAEEEVAAEAFAMAVVPLLKKNPGHTETDAITSTFYSRRSGI